MYTIAKIYIIGLDIIVYTNDKTDISIFLQRIRQF